MEINGHSIYIETHGPKNGRPVVLLHHGIGTVRSWKEQIPALAEAGFRVIAYDRWGHGRSGPRQKYGMPYFAADLSDLEGLLQKLSLKRPALVGHSDGGKIAMYYAASHPGDIDRLVVVSTHIYTEPKMAPGIEDVRRQFEADLEFRGKLQRAHGGQTGAVFEGWYRGWTDPQHAGWDMRPVLGKISCPVLVIQGDQDEYATPQHARDIAAAIPDSQLWLLPGAGHMLPQDHPQAFNARVIDFLLKEVLCSVKS
jgi:pimeloyl-ACP methyl ester carboxylesterase